MRKKSKMMTVKKYDKLLKRWTERWENCKWIVAKIKLWSKKLKKQKLSIEGYRKQIEGYRK